MKNGIKPCEAVHGAFQEGCIVCLRYRDHPELYAAKKAKRPVPGAHGVVLACTLRGAEPTGETVGCPTCKGSIQLKLYQCEAYGTCTLGKRVNGHGCCDSKCQARVAPPA